MLLGVGRHDTVDFSQVLLQILCLLLQGKVEVVLLILREVRHQLLYRLLLLLRGPVAGPRLTGRTVWNQNNTRLLWYAVMCAYIKYVLVNTHVHIFTGNQL